jgi:hypothetical protein
MVADKQKALAEQASEEASTALLSGGGTGAGWTQEEGGKWVPKSG